MGTRGHGARDQGGVWQGWPSVACPGCRAGREPAGRHRLPGRWHGAGGRRLGTAVSVPGRGGDTPLPLPRGHRGPQLLAPLGDSAVLRPTPRGGKRQASRWPPRFTSTPSEPRSPTQGPGRGGGAEEEPWAAASRLAPQEPFGPGDQLSGSSPGSGRLAQVGMAGAAAGKGGFATGAGRAPLVPSGQAVPWGAGFRPMVHFCFCSRRHPEVPSPALWLLPGGVQVRLQTGFVTTVPSGPSQCWERHWCYWVVLGRVGKAVTNSLSVWWAPLPPHPPNPPSLCWGGPAPLCPPTLEPLGPGAARSPSVCASRPRRCSVRRGGKQPGPELLSRLILSQRPPPLETYYRLPLGTGQLAPHQ